MNKDIKNPADLFSTEDRFWMAIVLLNHRDENYTVRDFSEISGLSLGFISKFSNLLKEADYLDRGRHMKLKRPGALLDILRDIYFFEKNSVQSFYTDMPPKETIKKIKKAGKEKEYALTRMVGASQIAPFVRYQLVDFYISSEQEISYWKEALQLVDVEISGNINLIVPSDKRTLNLNQKIKGIKVANSIQLYLDLYKYPARGREQAEYLREQILKI